MNEQEIQALAALAKDNPQLAAQLIGLATKASGTSNFVIPPHGYNALFNQPGVGPGIVATVPKPMGLEDELERRGHVRKSMELQPVYGILTGQTASSGSEPTGPCDESVPVAGDLKMCHQVWPFGEFTMQTRAFRVDNAGEVINRSEPMDLRLLNNPFANQQPIAGLSAGDLFKSKLAKAVVELTFDFKRRYARLIFSGNSTNASYTAGGVYGSVYNGLDKIVNTGYVDAYTGVACTAADPVVRSMAHQAIDSNAAATVTRYVELFRRQQKKADDLGLTVEWAFVMRYQKFLFLTQIWPCVYGSYRCSPVGSSTQVNIDATAQQQMRESMRKGRYLLIDGVEVPVLTDNTMIELNAGAGNFESDTYLLPLRVAELSDTNGQALFMDYFDYAGPNGMASILPQLGPRDEYKVSPDGRFAIHFKDGVSFCKQIEMRTRKRLILRTPFLAVKIEDERYPVYEHEDEWDPSGSFYYDGGRTSFAGAAYTPPV